ncbi:MAG: hypothetical protein SPJ21_03235 [Prevotella sp.]|nr:hypothetical protein [Prevotella sp.]
MIEFILTSMPATAHQQQRVKRLYSPPPHISSSESDVKTARHRTQ